MTRTRQEREVPWGGVRNRQVQPRVRGLGVALIRWYKQPMLRCGPGPAGRQPGERGDRREGSWSYRQVPHSSANCAGVLGRHLKTPEDSSRWEEDTVRERGPHLG